MDWDIFISHAWEDKESIARPLARTLEAKGYRVWFDEFTLTVGDGLRRSIDKGLANSRYGVVILSPHFFAKKWPQLELDGLASRETLDNKVILPVWHNIDAEQIGMYSPMLAGRLAVSSERGIDYVVAELLRAIQSSKESIAGSPLESNFDHQNQVEQLSSSPPSPKLPVNVPSLTELRDSLVFRVRQQILGQELEEGWWVKQILRLDGQQATIITGNSVGLFDIISGKALWKIPRSARCGDLNADGSSLAIGGLHSYGHYGTNNPDEVELWDIRSGLIQHSFEGHTDTITNVRFFPDGQIVASSSWDKTIRLWQIPDGSLIHTFRFKGEVTSFGFSPSGRLIVAGLMDGSLQVCKVADKLILRALAWHRACLNEVVFSPNGQLLASCSDDKTIIIWRVTDWSRLFTFAGHMAKVNSIAFSPNGQLLVSGSEDNTVKLWQVSDGVLLSTFKGHREGVNSVIFSLDGKMLVSGSNVLRSWRIA